MNSWQVLTQYKARGYMDIRQNGNVEFPNRELDFINKSWYSL